ncbi:hypothetical protein [Actinoplanes sp. M2I2]|uniref:hypothetical protein n=1 Tax=Actinoplanes sp. M2I2 TaxID=1734444 RepID=UPI0020219AB4|nr:hypothetical protein [Actinoplanes sp. M2I2]
MKVNPLTVLIAILIAVEPAVILGALLAIPVAGIIQIIACDIWDTRRGRLKPEPTIGEDEVPVEAAAAPEGVNGSGTTVVASPRHRPDRTEPSPSGDSAADASAAINGRDGNRRG